MTNFHAKLCLVISVLHQLHRYKVCDAPRVDFALEALQMLLIAQQQKGTIVQQGQLIQLG